MSGWLAFGGVVIVLTSLGWMILRGVAMLRRERKALEGQIRDEVQNDIWLRDVVLANDIRDRVANVADSLSSLGKPETEVEPKVERRGRRGAL